MTTKEVYEAIKDLVYVWERGMRSWECKEYKQVVFTLNSSEVYYDMLCKISKALGTEDISIQSEYESSGCDTCGGSSYMELTVRWPKTPQP